MIFKLYVAYRLVRIDFTKLRTVCKRIRKWSRLLFYLHACLPAAAGRKRRGHGGGVCGQRGCAMARLSGDGRMDGWMEISCYGVRRTATEIEPRAVAHRRPAAVTAATSVSIRPTPTTSPFPSLHPERHRARANGKLENMERLRDARRNPSGLSAGRSGFEQKVIIKYPTHGNTR